LRYQRSYLQFFEVCGRFAEVKVGVVNFFGSIDRYS